MDIIRVADKLKAFRQDFPAVEYSLIQSFTEDHVGDVARVVGTCQVIDLNSGQLLAEAHGTRALRPPVPGAQGAKDTRDPDRAMTQALGRVLGLLGYADGHGIEGDTDEPDETGAVQAAAPRPRLAAAPPPPPAPRGAAPLPGPAEYENPAAHAKAVLAGEASADPFVDTVATDDLKDKLNRLAPEERGKVRAGLSMAGFPTQIPDQLERSRYDLLSDAVEYEIEKLKDTA